MVAIPWLSRVLLLLSSVCLIVTSSMCSEGNATTSHHLSPYGQSKRHFKRYADPTFRGTPKTREEIWHQNFNTAATQFDQTPSLILLLRKLVTTYFMSCVPVILYDASVERTQSVFLQNLFEDFPITFMHGKIGPNYTLDDERLLKPRDSKCLNYIVFLSDVMQTRKVLGPQIESRIIVVPRSTQWKLQEFLMSPLSRDMINLLVIGESYARNVHEERPYVLYTHQLYVDGLGTNRPLVLTSWLNGKLTRPQINLFPPKFRQGFAGHRFIVAASNQPPFVFKIKSTDGLGNVNIGWEGIELRILEVMQNYLNFTIDIMEPRNGSLSPGDQVVAEVERGLADIGAAGCYVTTDRLAMVEMTVGHSRDCAAFLTLTSKALPRYRAIFGPFQYTVWIALTATYLIAIFPLAFSDKLTLRHLIGNSSEVENMFWYVFGTFTNCFTFSGKNSWSSSKKNSTRMLIGWYWVFTIIITACYTGSIIAFVTLPVFPTTMNTISQLLSGFYRVGTMDHGGWESWFANSTHPLTTKLLSDLEYVANIEEGINNVTKAFFWPYAFLGSRSEIEYIVQSNFSKTISKRSALHISDRCFGLFYTGLAMPRDSVYADSLNEMILYMQQAGLMDKLRNEVSIRMQRYGGYLLEVAAHSKTLTAEERGLTLADTEGMFLLLGIGFLIGTGVLISEWVGGCSQKCRSIINKRRDDQRRAQVLLDETGSDVSEGRAGDTRRHSSTAFPDEMLPPSDEDEAEAEPVVLDDERSEKRSMKSSDSRKTAYSLDHFSRQTMRDMYTGGHKRRHSNVIIMNGELTTESAALASISQRYEDRERLELEEQVVRSNGTYVVDVAGTDSSGPIEKVFGEIVSQ